MKQRIIFFDIDGTLLNHDGIIPESTKKALTELKKAGHLRFICTGRTKSILPQQIVDCNFDGYVMGAGTHVEYKESDLLLKTISEEVLDKTTKILKKYDIAYALEGPEHIYVEEESLEDERYFFHVFLRKNNKIVRIIKNHDYSNMVVNKMTVVVPGMAEEKLEQYHKEISQYYDLIIHERNNEKHGDNGIEELMPPKHNKGTGIDYCIQKLGLEQDQTIGVGDSNNDLEMLALVENAICMGNGTNQAKKLADYVTTSINEDGIYHAMKHFKLI